MIHFVPRDVFKRIISSYTGDRHVYPIKHIPPVIEVTDDNLNFFEVEEYTFNGGDGTSIGKNDIYP